MTKWKYYTGIGSRQTPSHIMDIMRKFAADLALQNYVLRSGGADGADSAFESGCDSVKGHKEIYLPWRGFNNNKSSLYPPSQACLSLVRKYHPRPDLLTPAGEKLMMRSVHQVLGVDLEAPSTFVVCWTPFGELRGGTAFAMRIALDRKIPIYNLYKFSYNAILKSITDLS